MDRLVSRPAVADRRAVLDAGARIPTVPSGVRPAIQTDPAKLLGEAGPLRDEPSRDIVEGADDSVAPGERPLEAGPDAGRESRECTLAPRATQVPALSFAVLARTASEQELTAGGDPGWQWDDAAEFWPYPPRSVEPEGVSLPLAMDGTPALRAVWASEETVYVVGSYETKPLVLRGVRTLGATGEGSVLWSDESSLLPEGDSDWALNSVQGNEAGEVFVASAAGVLVSRTPGEWSLLEVPEAVLPATDVWVDSDGGGVVVGNTVAATKDGGASWALQTRELGFVATGLAYPRRFVAVSGYQGHVSIVGAFGHLLTREEGQWRASSLLASDVALGPAGRFVTTRRPANGVYFTEDGTDWQLSPVTVDGAGFGRGAIDRVWAGADGQVLAAGSLDAIMHRFADGTWELLPAPAETVQALTGAGAAEFYALTASALYHYDLGEVTSSGAKEANFPDDRWLELAPDTSATWGDAAPPSFDEARCADGTLGGNLGPGVWQGSLAEQAPGARYGQCSPRSQRAFSETVVSFVAPVAGTYRFVLEQGLGGDSALGLALRSSCEGWVLWESGRNQGDAVDVGLMQGQVLLVEVFATGALSEPADFSLSIY